MGNIPLIACFQNHSHDSRVVDLLRVVQLAAPRIARRMDVVDRLATLVNATYDVAVHDLNMIDIE